MPWPWNILPNATSQTPANLTYAEVSTILPAPQKFTDPLYVVQVDYTTDFYLVVNNWPQLHGSALPQPGAACLLIADTRDNLRCIWWDGPTSPPDYISAKDEPFLAVGDSRLVPQVSITSGQGVATSASSAFSPDDVLKLMVIPNAVSGGGPLVSAIISWQSATQVTLANAATNSASSVTSMVGTDDTIALSAFRLACIETGQRGFIPPGNYMFTLPLAFGWDGTNVNLAGSGAGCTIEGAGAGAFDTPNWSSATSLWYTGTTNAITAFGFNGSSSAPITGLKLRGFAVRCLNLLGNFAIYWDGVGNSSMEDIAVAGYSKTGVLDPTAPSSYSTVGQGSGIRVNAFPNGPNTFRRVHAGFFNEATSVGWEIDNTSTAYTAATEGGGGVWESCTVTNCQNGWRLTGANVVGGCTFDGVSATSAVVVTVGSSTGYGFKVESNWNGNALVGVHANGFYRGVWFNGSTGTTLNGALLRYGGGSPGDGAAGLYFDNTATGNIVSGATFSGSTWDYGGWLITGTVGNHVYARFVSGFTFETADHLDSGTGNSWN